MPRRLRIEFEGAIYHVMARGNGRQKIVRDDEDRRRLIAGLEHTVIRCGWKLLSYVIMDNHLHLLLKTPRPNLAAGKQGFLSGYALWAGRRWVDEKLVLTGSEAPAGPLPPASAFLALKGPNRKAPGNARGTRLGTVPTRLFLLRPEGAEQVLCRPFRADSYKSPSIPRALPWAFLLGPFRAGSMHRRATNRAGGGIVKYRQQAQLFTMPGRRYRLGHVFQGRYRTEMIEDESHYWAVSRYVHLNPVRARRVARPEEWEWSSYPGYRYGLQRRRQPWFAHDALLASGRGDRQGKDAASAYVRFVEAGLKERPASPFNEAIGGWILGSERFVEQLRRWAGPVVANSRSPEARRSPQGSTPNRSSRLWPSSMGWSAASLPRRHDATQARAVAAWLCRRHTEVTLRVLAEHLGLARADCVPNMTRRIEAQLKTSPRLAADLDQIMEQVQARTADPPRHRRPLAALVPRNPRLAEPAEKQESKADAVKPGSTAGLPARSGLLARRVRIG